MDLIIYFFFPVYSSAGDQENSNAGSSGDSYPPSKGEGRIVTPNLKIYTFSELKNATKNFKAATMLGEGGFGSVYKGWVDEKTLAPSRVGFGIPVAVKKSNPDGDQGLKEWQVWFNFNTFLLIYISLTWYKFGSNFNFMHVFFLLYIYAK